MTNLSKSFNCSAVHLDLFRWSYSFVPTPKCVEFDAHFWCIRFLNKLWFNWFIRTPCIASPFSVPSSSTGELICPSLFLPLKSALLKVFNQYSKVYRRRNLSPAVRRCLFDLMHNPSIVIKCADKGSSWVIMDRVDYVN